MTDNEVTPEKIFKYASRYYDRHGRWPEIRAVAKRFKISQVKVENIVCDYTGTDYLGIATGIGTYSGVGSFDKIGDYLVEAY